MLVPRLSVILLAATLITLNPGTVWAHAGPRLSDPLEGSTLGDTPTVIRLYFSERPELSLSSIRVLDTSGVAFQAGRLELVAGDPLSLAVRVRPLPTGVYVVSWRVVSAVDGHATAGTYAFGVRVTPRAALAQANNPAVSRLELLARGILITGLVVMLGAGAAGVARFGGPSDVALAGVGWSLATVGLLLLAEAQRRTAAASIGDLLHTAVGVAVIERAVALAAAGIALACARSTSPRAHRGAMLGVTLAALAVMAVHVSAGHAAAGGRWPRVVTVAAQWVHFSAIGVWVGGLAALLFGTRGGTSQTIARAVRRFSRIAAASLLVVAATGAMLTIGVLSDRARWWTELVSTAYGKAVLWKIALLTIVAGFGAMNRWRSVPAALIDLRLLRRIGSGELVFMAAALVAAATLGTLPPPAGGAPPGLSVSGSDFGTTVRVELTTPSDQPGPNRFTVRLRDYDRDEPVRASRVSLRFTPLDDPGVASSALQLTAGPEGTYAGSGANLAFDGRWRVTTLIERGGSSVAVPLDLETRSIRQFVSLEHNPGQAPEYTVEVRRDLGRVRISPHPARAGLSKVWVTCFDTIGDLRPVDDIIVTAAAGHGPARQQSLRRVDRSRFIADVDLHQGANRIAVIARTPDGTRLRAALTLDIPR